VNFNESIKYRNSLLCKAITILKDKDDAEDIVQDTYIRAYNAWDTYKPNGATRKTWMFTILLNLIRNKLKYNKVRENVAKQHTINVDTTENLFYGEWTDEIIRYKTLKTVSSREPLPQEILETKRKEKIIFDFLNGLPKRQSNIMFLSIEGYEYKEIADKLKVPIGTIKSNLHRIRKRIKEILEIGGIK